MNCKYHPDRVTDRRLISWVSTSSVHAYPIDHGPQCRECIDDAMRRMPFSASWQHLSEPLPQSY